MNRIKFGKQKEYEFFSKMLAEGLDVYLPIADDHGVDCVVKKKDGTYIEVQIKAFSKDVKPEEAAYFANIQHDAERPNYYFVFHTEALATTWILSSKEFLAHCTTNKSGKDKGKRNIRFHKLLAGIPMRDPELMEFMCNDFSWFH